MADPLYHEADEENIGDGVLCERVSAGGAYVYFNSHFDSVPKELQDFSDQITAEQCVCKHCGSLFVRLKRQVGDFPYPVLSWQPHECPMRLLKRFMAQSESKTTDD